MKLGYRRKGHEGWAAIRNYANQPNCFSAYFDDTWTWRHAFDNSEVLWFGAKWTCSSVTDYDGSWGRDYMLLGVRASSKREHGAWCDYDGDGLYKFICESVI